MTHRRATVVAVVMVLSLAGCGAKVPPSPPLIRSADDVLILQMDPLPGYVGPEASFTHLPIVSVYADGRVISAAPAPAIAPGPAMPGLQIQRIPTSDVRRLVDRARAAGVGNGANLGDPGVTDMGSLRFSLRTDTGLVQTTAYALGEFDDSTMLSASQRAARKALENLRDDLTNLGRTLGSVPPPTPYTPDGVAAITEPWRGSGDESLGSSPPVPWPGPPLPGVYLDQQLGCVVATGVTATVVIAAAAHANALTVWTYAGKNWTLSFRPLLPDETSCQDLTG